MMKTKVCAAVAIVTLNFLGCGRAPQTATAPATVDETRSKVATGNFDNQPPDDHLPASMESMLPPIGDATLPTGFGLPPVGVGGSPESIPGIPELPNLPAMPEFPNGPGTVPGVAAGNVSSPEHEVSFNLPGAPNLPTDNGVPAQPSLPSEASPGGENGQANLPDVSELPELPSLPNGDGGETGPPVTSVGDEK